jgi:hypothetical protein
MDKVGLVDDAIAAMERLTETLEAETDAVQAHDMAAAAALLERKSADGEAYAAAIRALRDSGAMALASPEDREDLAAGRDRLDAALKDNVRSLKIARTASQKVFDVIAECASRAGGTLEAYTQGGVNRRTATGRAVSVALDGKI